MGLRTTETEYDNIDTPEFWERRKAEMAEPMPQLDLTERILRRQSRLRDAHGEYREQLLAEIAELEAQLAAEQVERDAAFLAAWPLDITTARRAEWNARVQGGEFTRRGKIDFRVLRAAEAAQGWAHEDLARAVKLHGL